MSINMPKLNGKKIRTISGEEYELTDVEGYGSQGVVYNEKTGLYLVKFYYPTGINEIEKDVKERLEFLMDIIMPKNFVAIKDVIDEPYIGYVMEKVDDYKSLNSYIVPPQNPEEIIEWYNKNQGLRARLLIGSIIAKAFKELERDNLSYCDISGNNILVKVKNSVAVKMIDVDNVYVAGKGKATVLGTPRYIAPEVIKKQKNPDVLSDNYALAVILFELLRVGHPYISDDVLDGTPEDEERALSGDGEYVTEENSYNMLPEELVFTAELSKLFKRCFVDGQKDRLKRPSASEFQSALLDAGNKVIKCPKCGNWYYARRNYNECPWECGASSVHPPRLNFYDVLYEGDSYKTGKIISKKIVNSFCLRPKSKNVVKSMYVLRYEDVNKTARAEENYVTVASNEEGYHVYNQFAKDGIVLQSNGVYKTIAPNAASILKHGDEVYFEINSNEPVKIQLAGQTYSFIRIARFVEGEG